MKIKNDKKTEKPDFNKNLENIYKDILGIKIKVTDSFQSSLDKFYKVMRKWGIKQGTWSENGRTACNAEWIMCFSVFKQHKILALDIWLCLNNPPKDLLAYGDEPKRNI